ncbi:protein RALF-like 34-like [Hibiscus syriacus]|uniref:Protein RALF-like 34-like n=1 Tax=Hibiscus syriacus TaxID=106335 RepID=A0A6A3A844_HIBSY|nr:mitogen-activated protein kinase kinase kinase 17-like [Hibiscus syriacus]XP_039005076.1 mitogen-activated protein kinase kinase kinase 17-like [Hibiscus syriacus]KAE8700053.1 protein RALF-like 34-like [Hibiscus syriacus]KAE8704980.1 protein RALF-like 34-like [Hibiscus syriacus]
MEWVPGEMIGYGSFGTVNLVLPKTGFSKSPLTVVKRCETHNSASLRHEKQVLDQLGSCPQIIRCLGDDYSVENCGKFYNLFLEYADKGSLADHVKRNGGGWTESDVKRFAKSILRGLNFVHSKGLVHCDVKLQNVLLFGNGDVKLADFGLAKRNGEKQGKFEIRGTPLNMAPESINGNVYDFPVDIWALGCVVVEMFTGKTAWNLKPGSNMADLFIKIGVGDELPGIPTELSEEGKDFLGKCFSRDPSKRWTTEMLLNHPFMVADDETTVPFPSTSSQCCFEEFSVSPRCPFDFPDWISTDELISRENSSRISSALNRIGELACHEAPNWSSCGSWISLR